MEKVYITADFIRKNIESLRIEFANDTAKLKFLDANERALLKETNKETRENSFKEMIKQLQTWDVQPNNPLLDEELDITGFAKLLKDIKEYESDTFSASGEKINDNEVVLVANKLVDDWSEKYIDGISIASALEEIRAEDEFSLELHPSKKK